jgi:RluA family pseudouridine synthase
MNKPPRGARGAGGEADDRRNEAVSPEPGASATDPAAMPRPSAPLGNPPPTPAPPATITILRREKHWIAVEKPSGLPSRPGPGHEASVLSILEAQLRVEGTPHPPGVVHRLDLGTSGVLLFSLTPDGHLALESAFHDGRVHKEYLAVAAGHPRPRRGLIDLALRRTSSGLSTPDRNGAPARTRYETREQFAASALVLAEPLTGRMHQIRAHLAARGTPVLGDLQYGSAELRGFRPRPPRLCLHAWRLHLPPELAGGESTIECALPADLATYLDRLRGPGRGGGKR